MQEDERRLSGSALLDADGCTVGVDDSRTLGSLQLHWFLASNLNQAGPITLGMSPYCASIASFEKIARRYYGTVSRRLIRKREAILKVHDDLAPLIC